VRSAMDEAQSSADATLAELHRCAMDASELVAALDGAGGIAPAPADERSPAATARREWLQRSTR
jgi:hypothetical protein